jgi:hypothetical protein
VLFIRTQTIDQPVKNRFLGVSLFKKHNQSHYFTRKISTTVLCSKSHKGSPSTYWNLNQKRPFPKKIHAFPIVIPLWDFGNVIDFKESEMARLKRQKRIGRGAIVNIFEFSLMNSVRILLIGISGCISLI